MSDRSDFEIDAALDELAAEFAASAPRPGADLVARVLADAANVSTVATAPAPATRPRRGLHLADVLFGWGAGATVAAALALVVGIGIGMQMDAPLPMMAADDPPEPEFLSADSGLLPDDFL